MGILLSQLTLLSTTLSALLAFASILNVIVLDLRMRLVGVVTEGIILVGSSAMLTEPATVLVGFFNPDRSLVYSILMLRVKTTTTTSPFSSAVVERMVRMVTRTLFNAQENSSVTTLVKTMMVILMTENLSKK